MLQKLSSIVAKPESEDQTEQLLVSLTTIRSLGWTSRITSLSTHGSFLY